MGQDSGTDLVWLQPLASLDLSPTNISNSTHNRGGALRKVKRREGEACWGKYTRFKLAFSQI